jgi:hypothetical protein
LIASGDTTVKGLGGTERPTALPIFLRQTSGLGLNGKGCGSTTKKKKKKNKSRTEGRGGQGEEQGQPIRF